MTPERFQQLLAAYGSRTARWPEAEREAAEALLRESATAKSWLEAEAELDLALAEWQPSSLEPDLSRRLLEIPVRYPASKPKRWPFRTLWAPGLGWAAAAAFGLMLGSCDDSFEATTATASVASAAQDTVVAAALGAFNELEEFEP
jgi:hypothetical protein